MKKLNDLLKIIVARKLIVFIIVWSAVQLTVFPETKTIGGIFSTLVTVLVGYILMDELRILYKQLRLKSIAKMGKKKGHSPEYSLIFAGFLQKPEDRESARGCLAERYEKDLKRDGRITAFSYMWLDIIMSFAPGLCAWISRISKWAFWGYIIEKLTR